MLSPSGDSPAPMSRIVGKSQAPRRPSSACASTNTATLGHPGEQHASARVSVRHELGERTALRWSLGRYFQPQGVHELQVEDGVTAFYPAQRADHAIVGVEHRLGERYLLRAEAYRKSLDRLRPRYENVFDPLAILPELEPDRTRVAADEAGARGVELSVVYAEPEPA